MKIQKINFENILKIWAENLWPQRQSKIESISWINHLGAIDMQLNLGSPTFWGVFKDEILIGTISGFQTSPDRYRSRGLWVDPLFRGQGLGKKLIQQVEIQALQERCSIVWTMPRLTSWKFYEKVGFVQTGETHQFEFGPHILADKNLTNQKLFNS